MAYLRRSIRSYSHLEKVPENKGEEVGKIWNSGAKNQLKIF
jgi:hypothetical protein